MAMIDVECANGHVLSVNRPLADWPQTPPCPECGAATEQTFLPPRTTWSVDPVVVFRAPDGSHRFPGDAHGQSADYYRRLGYERVEIRGAAEMRRFERSMSAREFSEASRKTEKMAEAREAHIRRRHSELRNMMQGMSERGKDFARAAMNATNQRPKPRAIDGGFHSDAYANYASNRDESRDPQGRRRRS